MNLSSRPSELDVIAHRLRKCPPPATLERKTGFEPATLTLAKVAVFVQEVPSSPLACGAVQPGFHQIHRIRPCCRAVY
jgi:hypothetical protein